MPQLFTLKGARLNPTYNISKKITIGNLPESDVSIWDIDKEEMPVQVEIEQLDNYKYILRKIEGAIPVLLNGNEIQEAILRHGDTIHIADIVFLFNKATQENILFDTETSTTDILALLGAEDREKNQLAAVYRLFHLTSNTFDLEELLNRLANFLLETFQATTSMVFLKEGEQSRFKPVVCKSRLKNVDWRIIKVSFSRKTLYLVSQKKRSILCRVTSDKGCSCLMISPMVYQSKVLGITVVEAKEGRQIFREENIAHSFSEHDLYLHGGISLLAANSIAHLQHYLERKRHTNRLEILNRVTLKLSSLLDVHSIYRETAKELVKLLQCTKCSVLYLDEDSFLRIGYAIGISKEKAKKIAIPYGKELAGWVVKHGKPLLSSALPDDIHPSARKKYHTDSFLLVPIFKSQGKAGGVICVTDRLNRSPFSRQDKEILSFIASRVGIALANASLYEQATVDFLTRLYLRGYFLERLKEAMEEDSKQTISLLMLDIDHFKPLNDTYGHQKGDIVLQQLGEFFIKSIRESDIPCRYGGEEFLILLKGISYEDAFKIAERIRESVGNFIFNAEDLPLRITVSIGVAQYEPFETCDSLLLRCDQALYRAKNSGRNKVC